MNSAGISGPAPLASLSDQTWHWLRLCECKAGSKPRPSPRSFSWASAPWLLMPSRFPPFPWLWRKCP